MYIKLCEGGFAIRGGSGNDVVVGLVKWCLHFSFF